MCRCCWHAGRGTALRRSPRWKPFALPNQPRHHCPGRPRWEDFLDWLRDRARPASFPPPRSLASLEDRPSRREWCCLPYHPRLSPRTDRLSRRPWRHPVSSVRCCRRCTRVCHQDRRHHRRDPRADSRRYRRRGPEQTRSTWFLRCPREYWDRRRPDRLIPLRSMMMPKPKSRCPMPTFSGWLR